MTHPDNLNNRPFYPFGSALPGRNWSDAGKLYRFGFNAGSELDSEIDENAFRYISTYYREGDNGLARWCSQDPKKMEQAWQSPYCYMDNSPVHNNDELGDRIKASFAERRMLRKRDDWEEIKKTYKSGFFKNGQFFYKATKNLEVQDKTHDKSITDGILDADIQGNHINVSTDFNKNLDHLYYSRNSLSESRVFEFDNTAAGRILLSGGTLESRNYSGISIGKDFKDESGGNVNKFLRRNSRSYDIRFSTIQIQPDDYNEHDPATYTFTIDGHKLHLDSPDGKTATASPGNRYTVTGKRRVFKNSKLNAKGVWKVMEGKYDECHGFIINIVVTKKKKRNGF